MKQSCLNILGLQVQALTKHDLVSVTEEAIRNRAQTVVGNHNLHSMYLCSVNAKMHAFYSLTDYVHIDGMSLVLLGRLLGLPLKSKHRTQYVDLLPLIAASAAKLGWRIFWLGSEPGVGEAAAEKLRSEYPGLQIATHPGYFETNRASAQNQAVLFTIREYAPDILMVGMGMPRQEIWISENLNDLKASIIFCCGAMMDFVAGEKRLAPRFLGPLGLEWMFRLCSEPARLWRRYLVEPWLIMYVLIREYLKSGRVSLLAESQKLD